MQVQAKLLADGKSPVTGVTYDPGARKWLAFTSVRWSDRRSQLACVKTREAAEAVANTYFPRLEAAVAEGKYEEELAAVKADLRAQVIGSLICDCTEIRHSIEMPLGLQRSYTKYRYLIKPGDIKDMRWCLRAPTFLQLKSLRSVSVLSLVCPES